METQTEQINKHIKIINAYFRIIKNYNTNINLNTKEHINSMIEELNKLKEVLKE